MALPRDRRFLGGPHEDDLAIAGGYLRAAEVTARYWIDRGPDDGLPIPILYLYRHGIELSLKWLIRVAARCAVRDGYTGPENLSPAKVDERLHTHNIKKLANCLNRYMGYLSLIGPQNRIDPESWQLLSPQSRREHQSRPVSPNLLGRRSRNTAVDHHPHRSPQVTVMASPRPTCSKPSTQAPSRG